MIKSKRRYNSNRKQWLSTHRSSLELMERIRLAYPEDVQVKVYQEKEGIIIDVKIFPAIASTDVFNKNSGWDEKSFEELLDISKTIFRKAQQANTINL